MKTTRIGINGFGRIGRLALRSCFTECQDKGTVMAINDHSKDPDYLMYLLKYDSVHGKFCTLPWFNSFLRILISFAGGFKATIEKWEKGLVINGHKIKVFKEKDPAAIHWGDFGADYVMECSGQVLT
jgi:glyceraldehyde 3-phosphate dehydrogenase